MGNKYKQDSDLEFLQFCDNEDLSILVDFLTKDKKGNDRITSDLLSDDRFNNCKGNYKRAWDLIATELQYYGGDTILNIIRRHGISYREILTDVCKKLKVNFNKKSSVEKIETNLFLKIIEDSLEKMTDEQKREFAKGMKLNLKHASSVAIMAALQSAIIAGEFTSYKIALYVANSVAKAILSRGLSFGVNAGLARGLAIFAGPVGWVITSILTIPMFSGTAYRVTIPSVIQVAYMRQKYLNKEAL